MNNRTRSCFATLALLCAATAGLLGPASSHAAAPSAADMGMHNIKISTFLFPKSVPAGFLQLAVTNDTKQEGEVVVGRLKNGMTQAAAVKIMLNTADTAFLQVVKSFIFLGGADQVQAGQTMTATLNVTPGSYALVNGDGAKPVYRFFTVTAAGGAAMAPPMATATVQLTEMRILGLPKHLNAGQVTIKATNVGVQVHNLAFIRLTGGKTEKDLLKVLFGNSQPAWAQDAGGVDMLSPHQTAYVTQTLTPGTYAALCFMPDTSKKGYVPHAAEGMITTFTVS